MIYSLDGGLIYSQTSTATTTTFTLLRTTGILYQLKDGYYWWILDYLVDIEGSWEC